MKNSNYNVKWSLSAQFENNEKIIDVAKLGLQQLKNKYFAKSKDRLYTLM